ncbi:MAG: DUF397 domain-containing protein [Acidimicrobiales bacterium]
MTDPNPPVTDSELTGLAWRTSSFGGESSDNVEVARLPDGRTALRNQNRPERGTVVFTQAEMAAWIKGCKAGEFDDIGHA